MADDDSTDPSFLERCRVALQGVKYDLNHLSQLPPARAGGGTAECVQYAVTRDGRFPFVLFVVSLLLLLLCTTLAVRRRRRY